MAVRLRCTDQRGARLGELLRLEPVNGNLRELRVGVESDHVGVRELLRLDHRVQGARRVVAVLGERKGLHDVEHLERRDALAVRRQLVDRPTVIRRRNRVDPLAVEAGHIRGGHRAAVTRERRENLLGDLALVECVASLGRDLFVCPRQVGVLEDLADRGYVAVDQVGLRGRGVGLQRLFAVFPKHANHFPDCEALLGVRDGGREDVGEFHPAEFREELVPAVHRSRDRHRVDAVLRHRGDSLRSQVVRCQAGGRPAGRVESVEFPGLGFVHDREEVAAHAVVHRRDEAHHRVGRDRRIDRVAAMFEDRGTDLRRNHALARHDPGARDDHRPRLRSVLRLRRKHGSGERQSKPRGGQFLHHGAPREP